MFRVRRGLDLPIAGEPTQRIDDAKSIRKVALVGADYPGMKPTLKVAEGDDVKRGQTLFTDKLNEAVHYTAPVSGRVAAINRGERRAFISLEIDCSARGGDEIEFRSYGDAALATLSSEDVTANLLESGLWTALRTRPYDKVPVPHTQPHAIFVNAMDTNPLAADPDVVLAGKRSQLPPRRARAVAADRGRDPRVSAAGQPRPAHRRHPARGRTGVRRSAPGRSGRHAHPFPRSGERDEVGVARGLSGRDRDRATCSRAGASIRQRVIALAGPQVSRAAAAAHAPRREHRRPGGRRVAADGECRVLSGQRLSGERAVAPCASSGRYSPPDHRARGRPRARAARLAAAGRKRSATACAFAASSGGPGTRSLSTDDVAERQPARDGAHRQQLRET